jgi:hypothetical protein
VKGKPWSVEDEKKLKEWVESGITDLAVLSFSFEGKYSRNAIYQKMLDLGIASREEEARKNNSSSSIRLTLPEELPSVEEALKTLAAAMKALETPGLDKTDVLRLRSLIQAASAYQIKLAEFIDYRGLEAELLELKRKYAELVKKTQNT